MLTKMAFTDRFALLRQSAKRLRDDDDGVSPTEFQIHLNNDDPSIGSSGFQLRDCAVREITSQQRGSKYGAVEHMRFEAQTADLKHMAITTLGQCKGETISNHLRTLKQLLMTQAQSLQMSIETPAVFHFGDTTSACEALSHVKNTLPGVQVTFVILGNKASYREVKAAAEASDLSMITQCVKEETLHRHCNRAAFADSLLKKVNAKMGYNNRLLHRDSFPSNCRGKSVMFVGAVMDATSFRGQTPLLAGVVGSLDEGPRSFHATTMAQPWSSHGKHRTAEYIQNLGDMIIQCLQAYQENNDGCLPLQIYFYRGGVAEGSIGVVEKHELLELKLAFAKMTEANRCEAYSPQLTYIIVKEAKNHVRPPRHRRKHMDGNVQSGTFVDERIEHAEVFKDFYVCSQKSKKGARRPARYYVVYDDADHSLDKLEALSFNLCHLHGQICSTVSIPVPIYYVHLAVVRAKEYLRANGSSFNGAPGELPNKEPTE